MTYVRVMIPRVGEWSQRADKALREDVGEVLVPDSEHDAPYSDYPDPPNDQTPPAAAPVPAATTGRTSRRNQQTSEGA